MSFSNGQMKSTVLIKVEGERQSGKKPSQFYAFGKTYNDIDDFLKQIRSKWTWNPIIETSNYYKKSTVSVNLPSYVFFFAILNTAKRKRRNEV